jgi:hypothetical protein|tara:strand:+ start:1400 stop:1564 length:165 start_codon:yes stop_codon:yes gene_type:complete
MNQQQLIEEFLSRFYDISDSPEAFNITIDEFYDEFPPETHVFLSKLVDDMQSRK